MNDWTATISPRPEVQRLVPDRHGGVTADLAARAGVAPEEIIDFSANVNPYGPAPGVLSAVVMTDLSRYPDPAATPLRVAIAEREGLPSSQVLVGCGTAQIIRLIGLAFVRPGDRVAVLGPCFGEYRVATEMMGGRVAALNAEADDDFAPPLDRWERHLSELTPRLVWLCNPNNPTGSYLGRGEVERLMRAVPDALWVIDEAYRPFVYEPWSSGDLLASGRAILLRSLTKDHALPGLRVGYALADPRLIEVLARVQPPWSVSAVAIAGGLATLEREAWIRVSLERLRAEASRLRAALRARGLRVIPSATHFFLVEVGCAAAVQRELLERHHILVRDATSFGLPAFIRISARRRQENERLIQAMEGVQWAR
ncbi:MAG: histidinol-phosphate transaminase [Anaerolineae bacterium]